MNTHGLRLAVAATLALSCVATSGEAQQRLDATVRAVETGTLRLQFKARDGVCAGGSGQSQWMRVSGTRNTTGRSSEWESECEDGPVRVAIDIADGIPTALRFYVGGRWRAAASSTDGGVVSAADAGAYFVRLAETASGTVARDAMRIATLADSSVIWPTLLRIARDAGRSRDLRSNALFWLGQGASDATATLSALADDEHEDLDVRKQAVFALSQRPANEAVPTLLAIARGTLHPQLRRTAIFWLGQSGDSRAVAYFEEVLTRP